MGQRDDADRGVELGGPGGRRVPVGRRPQVDQRRDHVSVAWAHPLQRGDRVQRGRTRRELVVDQQDRTGTGEQRRILGQQQMSGGVAVLLLERGAGGDAADDPAGRVQVVRVECLRDAVPETGGGLGIADDELGRHALGDGPSEPQPRLVDDARVGGDVLAQHGRHEQVRAPRVAS